MTARDILERVPLFHAARYEINLHASEHAEEPFERYIRGEFPYQTYLDLGTWYEEAGLDEDAERFFRLAAVNPVGGVRLAFLLNRSGRTAEAKAALDETAANPIAFALPFRRETLPALAWAAETRPEWKFKYYAAVGLAARGRNGEADRLLAACGETPDDEIFYLYRASRETGEKALRDLRNAAKRQNSWRTGHALYRHFANEKKWEEALAEVAPYAERFPEVNLIKLAYGNALARSGRYGEAIAYLEKVAILPSEGGDNASAAWIYANRGVALEALEKGDREGAKRAVAKALSFPENLGRGKPYDRPKAGDGLLEGWPDALIDLIEWQKED